MLLVLPLPAAAGSSDWFATDGARLRLVAIDEPTADGTLRGALEIALDPGWKTYWADPGDAGIPPQIDVTGSTNVAAAELAFPPPQRFRDAYVTWAGYRGAVSLPVTFRVDDPARFSAIDATVTLGVCEEVCIPVHAQLSVIGRSATEEDDARAVVEQAFAALPPQPDAAFGVASASDRGKAIEFQARVPADAADAELFVITPAGMKLGHPSSSGTGAERTFSFPIERRGASAPAAFDYTLVAGEKAVSGRIGLD
jgi:DsbC/DsbD-like thiol-disulfide interchange protein